MPPGPDASHLFGTDCGVPSFVSPGRDGGCGVHHAVRHARTRGGRSGAVGSQPAWRTLTLLAGGFAESPSKWRKRFSGLCGGSESRTVVQGSTPSQRDQGCRWLRLLQSVHSGGAEADDVPPSVSRRLDKMGKPRYLPVGFVGAQIRRHRFLAAVVGQEIGGQRRVPGTNRCDVAAGFTARSLDLDDLRTQVGQRLTRKRARHVLREIEHPKRAKGVWGCLLLASGCAQHCCAVVDVGQGDFTVGARRHR
jgi:hypothetical protein